LRLKHWSEATSYLKKAEDLENLNQSSSDVTNEEDRGDMLIERRISDSNMRENRDNDFLLSDEEFATEFTQNNNLTQTKSLEKLYSLFLCSKTIPSSNLERFHKYKWRRLANQFWNIVPGGNS